jgi:membrane-bound metal-dependent hydrolase YbcI (DUF457 family)
MPDWKTHFIFGLFLIIAWLAIFQYATANDLLSSLGLRPFEPASLAILIVLTQLATLFPDVDIKNSRIRTVASFAISLAVSTIYVLSFPKIWIYGPVYFALLFLILKFLPTKHRGMTHTFQLSLLFSVCAGAATVVINPTPAGLVFWFAIALAGYNMHLLLDRF